MVNVLGVEVGRDEAGEWYLTFHPSFVYLAGLVSGVLLTFLLLGR